MGNRIIKDTIRTSRTVNAMTDFQFRFWVHLITYVDDYGRGSADPEILKGFVFPRRKGVTESTIEKALADLANIGSVLLYEVDGEPYFCFPNWGDHQRIQTKKSKYPAPEEGNPRWVTVGHGESPPESNPNPNTNPNTKPNQFEAFWDVYPKKVGKGAAQKAFEKVRVPVADLISAVERQKTSEQWRKEGGKYIPNPATWLNQGRWEDELPTAGAQKVANSSSDLSWMRKHIAQRDANTRRREGDE